MSRKDRGRGTRADNGAVARGRRDTGQPGISKPRVGRSFRVKQATWSNTAEF